MNNTVMIRLGLVGVVLALLGLRSASVLSDTTYTAGTAPSPVIAQLPLYLKDAVPPLNMLVMGRDHKNYYEAYNDASDLNGDGVLDVGYKPGTIDYYGYFNSKVCYTWDGDKFIPASVANGKKCSGQWSGDFLNYLTTSRMDALRRVLYGGWRQIDSTTQTVLQGAYLPQDGHSWGKEYQSVARDGYDISKYTPLNVPAAGKYHLFAVTTLTGNSNVYPGYQAPMLRVLVNGTFRVWNWLSIEGPVAGNRCFSSNNQRVNCVGISYASNVWPASNFQNLSISTWKRTSGAGSPADKSAMDKLFNDFAVAGNLCGSKAIDNINATGQDNNPFNGVNGCGQDNYLTRISGTIVVPANDTYSFAVDGDDAVDLFIDGNFVVGWYGGHGSDRSSTALGNHSANVTLTAGAHSIVFRHQEATGGDNWGLLSLEINNSDRRDDYYVRVLACPASDPNLRDDSCKAYDNGGTTIYKPTGILHDYGETQKMYFGLITGSQYNNLEGGVLRRNISNFADEIDPATGIFKTSVDGIARSIDKFRMIGGGYNNSVTDNSSGDTNWNWANNNSNCPTPDVSRPLNNGECRMWGNPLAEMAYEAMRYFAGAAEATPRFSANSPGDARGIVEETTMGLTTESWKDPYASDGGKYPSCAKPYETIISDINPSYDGDVPGSAFAGAIQTKGVTPSTIAGFSASAEGQAIWDGEYAGPRRVFIGDVAGTTDNAPTAKLASSFGNIRGLSPEEPSKNGTYYTASVARFGRNSDLNAVAGQQNMSTYSIALASPLPRIEFPVGNGKITLIPFAKTTSGTFGKGARKPTNTIVDFYVEQIVNLDPTKPKDMTVNGGRPSAIFRINYEDSEQGNDHDMDAIVRYLIQANADGTATVTLNSEYAAGSADQNMGFVMSGTTQDGVYLEVRDLDSTDTSFMPYDLNTPNPLLPGGCVGVATGLCNQRLPTSSTRVFTPATGGAEATQLRDPLWYAAKYGAPNLSQIDADGDGTPDNYFLVTNPLYLRTQLAKAFEDIANRDTDVGVATVSGARVGGSSFTLQPTFKRARNGKDWTGNLTAAAVSQSGVLGTSLWSAKDVLPVPTVRNIRTITDAGTGTSASRTAADFQASNLGNGQNAQLAKLGVNIATRVSVYGSPYSSDDFVAYLRGDQTNEAANGGKLRTRTSVLGDIVNSEPIVASPKSDFGYGYFTDNMFKGYSGTGGYLSTKSSRKTVAYVGANDGMLHAFNASTVPCGNDPNVACAASGAGRELFAFVPNGVLGNLGNLARPDASYQHQYYVDGQITVGDAKQNPNIDTSWKTLLAGSAGGGARSVFVLDVSNPDSFGNAQMLWERNSGNDTDIGNVYGKPLIVPLENGKWGVLFGNGYGGDRSDPSLYVLDAFTGDVIRKLTGDDGSVAVNTLLGTPCGLLDVLLGCKAKSTDPFNGLGQITAIDKDGDGKIDTVYGGDLQGNLWKFDLSDASASNWKVANQVSGVGKPLFTAVTGTERQPITGGIRVAAGPGTGVMVYFGTGRYFLNGDNDVATAPQVQSLYGIFDNGTRVANGRADLQAQAITSETVGTEFTTRDLSANQVLYYGTGAKRGFYIDLKLASAANGVGERFIATPRIQSGRVFFTTYTPTKNSCDPGGSNFQYVLDLLSGAGELANVQVLPTGTVACTGSACGGVTIGGNGAGAQAPVVGTGVVATNPVQKVTSTCNPAVESCATFEQCQVVIYPGGFVLPRPCGRQSWRQLK